MEAVIGLVGGLIGAVLGAWCAVQFPRSASRRQVALQLLDRYTSQEFFVVRSETWHVQHAWGTGDRSVIQYFVRASAEYPSKEPRCSNGLSPHQNLSWLLHFFVSVQLHHEAGLVDGRLLKILFEPHYKFYEQFFHEFCDEYRKKARPGQPDPAWLTGLPKLEKVFHEAAA